ncbi:MAG: helix-turn-helix domain-containing protein [Candidatus Neomarinimicrobiota bacterium]
MEMTFQDIYEKIDKLEQKIKPEFPNWLSVHELAEYLRVSESQIRKLVSDGSIPYRRVGQAIRFNRKQVDLSILSGGLKPSKRARATFEALL